MSGRISDSLNANTNNEPDISYYNLVESYISSTREMLNGFMTFERGLVRILNNRIIFRNIASAAAPVVAPDPIPAAPPVPAAPAPAPAPDPAPAPAPHAVAPLSQEQPITATFVRYRLPLPSVTSRAERSISTPTPNLSVSLSSSPPRSPPPPPPPPPHTQSLSPILPINSRINRSYDLLDFIDTTNINHRELNRDETINSNYFQRLLQLPLRPLQPLQPLSVRPPIVQREQRAEPFMPRTFQQQRPQPPPLQREEQREQREQRAQTFFLHEQPQQPPHQSEGDPNYVSYDTIQIATKLIPFCTIHNPKNEICPISQIHFEEIDCIMQINHCKHNFNPYSLFRWLDSNSTCPMCRYNLNSYSNDYNDDEIRIGNHYNRRSEIAAESESESEFD